MNSVLIIDDDKELCALMKKCVEQENLSAVVAHGGLEGLRLLEKNKDTCSLIILDVMMPDMNGFQVLQKIREKNNVPVLMLTAKSDEEDKVSGLRLGADDYLVKPFDVRELLARVRALARRPAPVAVSGRPCCGDLTLDMGTLVLTGDKEQCTLSKKEAELLAALMENAGQTLSRSFLFGRVWGPGADVEEASLDSYVHFIRRRLRAVSSRVTVDTVRGVGYRLLDGGTGA